MAKSEAAPVFALGIRLDWRQASILLVLLGLLTFFILVPIARVLWVSLSNDEGGLTLVHFANFFRRPLFRESLWNSLVAGLLVVFFGSLIAVPLAYLSVRYDFKGKILVNTRSVEVFFARPVLRMLIQQPLIATNRNGQYDVTCTVSGGGLSGQAGAVRHGLAKALTYFEPDLRGALKRGGFLTRDPRVVERKKYGRAKARRSFQFSKR